MMKNGIDCDGKDYCDDGYFYDGYFYYYEDPGTGKIDSKEPIEQEPFDTTQGSEDCRPLSLQVGFWDETEKVLRTISWLNPNDVKKIQNEAMTKTYGQKGRFRMENGGTVSYETKSHSLIVKEMCDGNASRGQQRNGSGRKIAKRPKWAKKGRTGRV